MVLSFVPPSLTNAVVKSRPTDLNPFYMALSSFETNNPNHLRALELDQVLSDVAKWTSTRRGQQALQEFILVRKEEEEKDKKLSSKFNFQQKQQHRQAPARLPLIQMAQTRSEAVVGYEQVEQARLCLNDNNDDGDDPSSSLNLSLPPILRNDLVDRATSQKETNKKQEEEENDDFDEWLYLPSEEWTLEHVVQAEQLLKRLLKTIEWSQEESITTWTPALAAIMTPVYEYENNYYQETLTLIQDAVDIRRVSTVQDISGRSSFSFELRSGKFPNLDILRAKLSMLQTNSKVKEWDSEFVELQTEIDFVERQILQGLVAPIRDASGAIDEGLQCLAELDIVFSKALWGYSGSIPTIGMEGLVDVKQFQHPLLHPAVPLDLALTKGLIISGPNGGGKTLAMKSFGLVACMAKLGLPLPCVSTVDNQARVDFFESVQVQVGDHQSVSQGESTWTAKLHELSTMLQNVESCGENESTLVLLDELGSGTDPEAGGAIGQSILEEFLTTYPSTRVIATTHSPRLKSWSYHHPELECATVLLRQPSSRDGSDESGNIEETRALPTFELEYGSIGDSHALGAATRCRPPLPGRLLKRAATLLAEDAPERGAYIQSLVQSTEEQLVKREELTHELEVTLQDTRRLRSAVVSLAKAYEHHFARLEQRLEEGYQVLQTAEDMSSFQIIGSTLNELRIVQKQVASQREQLAERGLKLLDDRYDLQVGETVVLLENDCSVKVTEVRADSNEVQVELLDLFDMEWTKSESSIVVGRPDLALWDYDSVWQEDDDGMGRGKATTSISDSKRKLGTLLSSLSSTSTTSLAKDGKSKSNGTVSSPNNKFTSSRERKANKKAKVKTKSKRK